MNRVLLVIALLIPIFSSEGLARFVYSQNTVGWRFTPASGAIHYRVEILYSTENDFQTLIENLPPDM